MIKAQDPQKIEQEIRNIQHSLSPNEAKTSLFNLVIFIPSDSKVNLDKLLSRLHGRRPSRIIMIHLGHKGETSIEVSAKCVDDHEERGICLQEIHIFSGEDHSGEDHGTWAPLLIREIPVFLLWLGKILPYPKLLLESEDQVDRIIVDSRNCSSPLEFYRNLRDHGHWKSMSYGDLSWGRITPLLKATALIFNPEHLRDKLWDLSEIQFRGGHRAEATLFFLWLKAKLGWELEEEEEDHLRLTGENQSIILRHTSPDELENGFELSFFTTKKELFRIKSSKEGFIVNEAPDQEKYTSILKLNDYSKILLAEVDRPGQDRLLSEAIQKL